MGTKGSYSGGGGKPGSDLRQNIEDWLDSLPDLSPPGETLPPDQPPDRPDVPPIRPQQIRSALGLFAPRPGGRSDGPGSGGGGSTGGSGGRARGGAQRTVSSSSRTAGRAAAAAYALRTGNADLLRQEFGLDYESLRANPDIIDVARQIMVAACGPLPDGTIEEEEQRVVAAQVAQYVLEASLDGELPTPEEIVRETISCIVFEAISTETAAKVHNGERSDWVTAEVERQLREATQAWAFRVDLSRNGATPAEFEKAIAEGIEMMHTIWGSD
ncbi:hypothetical protein MXD62_16900 [Frankia sp. Mgl5]|uniref:hypothetical protein n=1 Tax=Frankia sp. Mgl5 TaxID=2933793 RepID=UPI00200FEABD|nr:hypothetical protein [Frankia sp. Mgl5]MCK9928836.1 hypothetical protein [Frankia sp. Mgl5]